MHPTEMELIARLWRNTPVRAGLLFTALFLIVLVVSSITVFVSIQHELTDRLDSRVAAQMEELTREFEAEGLPGLVGEIEEFQSLGKAPGRDNGLYSLTGADGINLVSGPVIAAFDDHVSTIAIPVKGDDGVARFRAMSTKVGAYGLVAGLSSKDIEEVGEILLTSLLIAAGCVLLLGFAGAMLLTRAFQQRLDGWRTALAVASTGNWNARLPVSSRTDDIDGLAASVNTTLDRLQASMEAVRQVSADIAHDLKTPLAHLLISAEEALEKFENGEVPLEELHSIEAEGPNDQLHL